MKKTIIVEVLLAFVFAVLLYGTILGFCYGDLIIGLLNKHLLNYLPTAGYNELIDYYSSNSNFVVPYSVPALIAAVIVLVVMVVIAIFNFPRFKSKFFAKINCNAKKIIAIEIMLAIALAVLLYVNIMGFRYVDSILEAWRYQSSDKNSESYRLLSAYYSDNLGILLSYLIPALIAIVANITAIVIIALKYLPIKQWINNFKTKRTERKEQRSAIAKQDRIAKLEAELDELKKDE